MTDFAKFAIGPTLGAATTGDEALWPFARTAA